METDHTLPVYACDDCGMWVSEENLNQVRRMETLHVGTDMEISKISVRFICRNCATRQFGGCDMFGDEEIVNSSSIHADDLVNNQVPPGTQNRVTNNFYVVMVQSHQRRVPVASAATTISDDSDRE